MDQAQPLADRIGRRLPGSRQITIAVFTRRKPSLRYRLSVPGLAYKMIFPAWRTA
jgi:hypothetical protein